MELGETLEEVARRELIEETGLIANELRLLDIFSGKRFYYKYPHGDEVYNVVTAYVCSEYDGQLVIDENEVQALSFFHFDELPENISPPDAPIIKQCIKEITKD